MLKLSLNIALLLAVLVVTGGSGRQKLHKDQKKKAPSPPSSPISYKSDIIPVLKKYCLPCHTEDQMNPSELYLDTYEGLMTGGKHGKPVIPGKPDSSLIIQKLTLKPPPFGDPMPMKRKTPFPEDTVKILRKWIEQGAKKN